MYIQKLGVVVDISVINHDGATCSDEFPRIPLLSGF